MTLYRWGWTNAKIARATGYTRERVRQVILRELSRTVMGREDGERCRARANARYEAVLVRLERHLFDGPEEEPPDETLLSRYLSALAVAGGDHCSRIAETHGRQRGQRAGLRYRTR